MSTSKSQSAGDDASKSVSDAFHALLHGVGGRRRGARLARGVPLLHRAQPVLPAQGRPDDPALDRAPHGRPGRARPHDHAAGRCSRCAATSSASRRWPSSTPSSSAWARWSSACPQVGAIMVINFVAAYIPYLGAWSAGAFTVLIALGSQGTSTALAMAVIVLLANGILQQMIQPIAYGAALGIHPLAVLIVTIAGGALFGGIGLILAAPLTSAVVKISGDLARARAARRAARGAPSARPTGSPRRRLRKRAGLGPHPLRREAVRVRPARRIGRDDRHGNAEVLNALGQRVTVPVLVVLARRREQDLVALAALHERRRSSPPRPRRGSTSVTGWSPAARSTRPSAVSGVQSGASGWRSGGTISVISQPARRGPRRP